MLANSSSPLSRLAWATDLHLNFLRDDARGQFIQSLRTVGDALLITGDIAESHSLVATLRQIAQGAAKPIYYVLGNHDFYRGSIASTRAAAIEAGRDEPRLVYLTSAGIVELSPRTALVGHDGWADGRFGDFHNSRVILNDFSLIQELRQVSGHRPSARAELLKRLQTLGDEAASFLRDIVARAAASYRDVLVATHVPPFREAAWHEGRTSGEDFLPFFACRAVGEALVEVARSEPNCRFLVLCGHTHGGGEIQVLDNLRVLTGAAEYRAPRIDRVLPIA